jgi:hypothetical protein
LWDLKVTQPPDLGLLEIGGQRFCRDRLESEDSVQISVVAAMAAVTVSATMLMNYRALYALLWINPSCGPEVDAPRPGR